jgi:DNA invertase Pin-like site-specific DNA recombinase
MGTVRAYERISVGAEDASSLTRQATELARWAAFARPDQPVEHYRDAGISGAKAERLRERQRLLKDLGPGDTLAVTRVDRLARSTRDLLDIVRLADDRSATVIFVEQNIDTSGAYGKFMLTMLAALAELEREVVAERIGAARKTYLSQGRYAMGRLPYGWHAVKDADRGYLVARPILAEGPCERCEDERGQPVVHHTEGARLRQAVLAVIAGKSFASQARSLGIGETTFSALVRNPRLYGMPRDDGAIFDPESAIITKAQWVQLQRKLSKRPEWVKADTLAGAFRCYRCDKRLYVDSWSGKYRCETRPHHPARPTVDRETADAFLVKIFHEWYGQFPAYRLVARDDSERAERLAGIKIELDELGKAIVTPGADIPTLSAKIAELHTERQAILDEPAAEAQLEPTGRTWAQEWGAAESDEDRVRLVELMSFYVILYPYSERGEPERVWTDDQGSRHTRTGRFEIVERQA